MAEANHPADKVRAHSARSIWPRSRMAGGALLISVGPMARLGCVSPPDPEGRKTGDVLLGVDTVAFPRYGRCVDTSIVPPEEVAVRLPQGGLEAKSAHVDVRPALVPALFPQLAAPQSHPRCGLVEFRGPYLPLM